VGKPQNLLDACTGFEWDDDNALKNWRRHQVTMEEAEDIFFAETLILRSDILHSRQEKRYMALGRTSRGRCLFTVFTIRRNLIRIISVRDMNRREREAFDRYEETTA
jgi:uncharacterized DUF497 family protein